MNRKRLIELEKLLTDANEAYYNKAESIIPDEEYDRLKDEKKELPDLINIDGGKGQLAAAIQELGRLRVQIPVISIAKEREEIYVHGLDQPLSIKRDDKALLFVQEIRNEAHRFAINYNRLLRQKALISA